MASGRFHERLPRGDISSESCGKMLGKSLGFIFKAILCRDFLMLITSNWCLQVTVWTKPATFEPCWSKIASRASNPPCVISLWQHPFRLLELSSIHLLGWWNHLKSLVFLVWVKLPFCPGSILSKLDASKSNSSKNHHFWWWNHHFRWHFCSQSWHLLLDAWSK